MTTRAITDIGGWRNLFISGCFLLMSLLSTSAQSRADMHDFKHLGGGVYMSAGLPGPASADNQARTGNIAFVVGDTGVLVWNSGVSYLHGQQVLARILSKVQKPVRLLIVSHAYQDVLFGWRAFTEIGIEFWMHKGAYQLMNRRCQQCLTTLTGLLGESAMYGTGLAKPDRIVEGSTPISQIGRRVRLLDLGFSSGPNDLVLFDHQTGTLFAGPLVMTDRLLEIRDGRRKGWLAALDRLSALPVRRVVPDYGRVGDQKDIVRTRDYLSSLSAKARALLKARVGLSQVVEQGQLPAFAQMQGYEDTHARNIHQMYLRMEQDFFE